MTDSNDLPQNVVIVDNSGNPTATIDLDRMSSDATRLMYAMAATAGDDDATDRVSAEWAGKFDPDYFGYLAAGALSLLTRNVLGPVLDVTAELGADLRAGLREAADNAEQTLGGAL